MHRIFLSSALLVSLLVPSLAAASPALDFANIVLDGAFDVAQDIVKVLPGGDTNQGAVSNVLKTRHDTVKNSINNVR